MCVVNAIRKCRQMTRLIRSGYAALALFIVALVVVWGMVGR